VYSREEVLWLENFRDIELSREERTVIRLGATGELISPQTIWETVGIVDTDVYRQLLESLRQKGVLISEITKPQALAIARKKGIRDKKSIPRFRIIVPQKLKSAESHKAVSTTKNINDLDDSDYAKLFIDNIPFEITEYDIEKKFSKYGDVTSIVIPRTLSNKSRGYAFIEFDSYDSVKRALKDKYNIYLLGRKIIVKKYKIFK